MLSKEGCIDSQKTPAYVKGDTVDNGLFYRNLKRKGEASKRYENDDDSHPMYGFKLTKKFWKNAVSQDDLSLNEVSCTGSAGCSIAIHPYSDSYFHVATIDLGRVNEMLSDHSFVAQYDPLESPPDGPNQCHYELLPVNGTTQSLFALQLYLDSPFPRGKMPNSTADCRTAEEATCTYNQVVSIKRWVREDTQCN